MRNILRLSYRDHDRTPLLFVIKELAARFEDLDIDLRHVPDAEEYRSRFLKGDSDLICEHLRFLFPSRLEGYPVRCLAATELQAVECLVSARPIRTAEELAGKTIAVRDQESARLTLKYWLRTLGVDGRAKVEIYSDGTTGRWEQWREITKGKVDVALCSPLYMQAAIAAGLHVAELPPLAVIGPLFFATQAPVIHHKEEALRAFMRALYRGIRAFLHDPEYSIGIFERGPAQLMGVAGRAAIEAKYEALRMTVADKPIPRPECILNTFDMLRETLNIASLNPLEMWDLRYVIELEEQRFMESLRNGLERTV